MTAEPPADLAKMIADGLTSWNADEFVPKLPQRTITVTDTNHNVTVSFTNDEFDEVATIYQFGGDTDDHSVRMTAALGHDDLVRLYEDLIKPILDRTNEVKRLADAADDAFEAERALYQQEQDAHTAASAFRIQEVSKKGASSYQRLHKHTCTVLDRARALPGDGAITLDQLLTVELPAVRDQYEKLVSPTATADNYERRKRRIRFDNTVFAVCGQCKPIGPPSKFVSDELHRTAHLVVHDPDAMADVARLLLAIEMGSKITDTEYQATRD